MVDALRPQRQVRPHIDTVDEAGVALAAIQALSARVKEQDARIAEQQAQPDALAARLDAVAGGAPEAPASAAARPEPAHEGSSWGARVGALFANALWWRA